MQSPRIFSVFARPGRPALVLVLGVLMATTAAGKDLAVQHGTIDVQYTNAPSLAFEKVAAKWIKSSAHAVADYYGGFTVRHAVLQVTPAEGHEVSGGRSFGYAGA